ncbi:MAG TPA: FecR domain-containing protein [Hymenobacter sp.]|jgi:ferric-dicitrate binding protein FerR (iron transport regulator)|uniref:FecR family protein n=1 Tax=Hymenobacter sp. TaxID=1898978 RepID=UPI002ED8FA7C
MDPSEFRALLHRYQQGECTPAEKRRVEEWYNGLGTEQKLDLSPLERNELVDSVWQRISEQTTAAPNAPTWATGQEPVGNPRWTTGVRWAAVALLALGTGVVGTYLGWNPAKEVAQAPTESSSADAAGWLVSANTSTHDVRVALPDGSSIALAPASTLKYPRAFTGTQRTVYLTGAAFFDVSHDAKHPFLVYTDKVVTKVLGTSFRVEAYAGQAEAQVQVKTGRVQVTPRGEVAASGTASVLVLPNQQAVYSATRQRLRREVVAQPALLKPQSFVFDNRPVAEVLTALEKAYGVAIVYDAAAVRNCTLNLGLGDEPLFAKLDVICETLGASYEKADGRILFHSQPCPAE